MKWGLLTSTYRGFDKQGSGQPDAFAMLWRCGPSAHGISALRKSKPYGS